MNENSAELYISRRTMYSLKNVKNKQNATDQNSVFVDVHRAIYYKYPRINQRVTAFISSAHNKRLSVSVILVQE